MDKGLRLLRIKQVKPISPEHQETIRLLEQALRPTLPDRKLARRIKQHLTAEWFARHLIAVLFMGIVCVGLFFGVLRGQN
jgi:hypothetical protein